MRKKLRLIIIIASIVAGGIVAFFVVREVQNNNKLLTANERMMQEADYIETLQEFVSSVDTITVGYISGEYDREAYMARLNILKEEFAIIEGTFNQWLKDNPIDMNSQSFISNEGESSVTNANKHTKELLECTIKEDGTPYDIKELAYRYLQAKQVLQDDLISYIAANKWVQEADTFEEDFNALYNQVKEGLENGQQEIE